MRFHVITVFPEMIESAARFGVVGQAVKDGRIALHALSPRAFTTNVHQTVDDRPFGGGDGMVMLAEALAQALESVRVRIAQATPTLERVPARTRVIHLSPRGTPLTDAKVRELVQFDDLVLIASRYGGVDQRFLNQCVDEEISIGDYVLSGGELPALVLLDAVARQLPGVLGNEASAEEESFADGLLEQPQFTRPREWQGVPVPAALLSGDHAKIAAWKKSLSILVTAERRPELVERALIGNLAQGLEATLDGKDLNAALDALEALSLEERRICGIRDAGVAKARLLELLARFPIAPSRRRRRGPGSVEGNGK